jgi:tetratricopeptide (TPR) repeat protein
MWRRTARHRTVVFLAAAAVLVTSGVGAWAIAGLARAEGRRKMEADRARSQEEAFKLLESARAFLDGANVLLYSPRGGRSELIAAVDKAQPLIERAIERCPDLAAAHFALGRAWEFQGREDRAEAEWRKSLKVDFDFAPARLHLGRLLIARAFLASGSMSESERVAKLPEVERLVREAAEHIDAALRSGFAADDPLVRAGAAGMLAYARDDMESVRRIAESALKEFDGRPGSEELHWLTGIAATGPDRIPHFERALAIRPKYGIARLCLAVSRYGAGNLEGSIRDYDQAVELNPNWPLPYTNRGVAKLELGNVEGALQDHTAAIGIDPGHVPAYLNRSLVRQAMGDIDGAIDDYAKAIELDPANARARSFRGMMYHDKNMDKEALADADEAVRLAPDLPLVYNNRAISREAVGDREGAIQDYTKAISLSPRYAKAYRNRGSALLECGKVDQALSDFAEAVRIDPDFLEARLERAPLLMGLSRWKEAIEDLTAAIRLAPGTPEHYANRANALYRSGDLPEAAEDLKRALDHAPVDWPRAAQVRELLDSTLKEMKQRQY